SWNRSDAESFWFNSGSGKRNESSHRLQTTFTRQLSRGDQQCGGAIARLRRVASGYRAGSVKCGPKLRKRFDRRVAPRSLIDFELNGFRCRFVRASTADAGADECGRERARHYWHDLVSKSSRVDSQDRPLMTPEGEGVLFLA